MSANRFSPSLLNETLELTASVAAAAAPITSAPTGPNSFELISKAVGVFVGVTPAGWKNPLDDDIELMLTVNSWG
jgi:hypothetical protein